MVWKPPHLPTDFYEPIASAYLVTDAQGRVTLKKIGPLPVAIDIAFADDQGKEWQVADPRTASLYFPSGGIGFSREVNGRRVAIYSDNIPGAPGMRLARASSRLANCAPQKSDGQPRLLLAGLPGEGPVGAAISSENRLL